MDKKTLLAVALSVVVIILGFVLPRIIWPSEPAEDTAQVTESGEIDTTDESITATEAVEDSDTTGTTTQLTAIGQAKVVPAEDGDGGDC